MIRWFVLLSLLAVVNGSLSMDRWIGKVAVVTGASSGIGKAIAEKLVEEGVKVVGVARRKDRLDELAQKLSTKQGKFFAFKGDLSKEEDIVNAFKWTKQNVGPVSILINNAGVAPYGLLSNGSTEDWQNILNINVLAICIANREAIKQMKENNIDGHIININSVLGHAIKDVKILNLYSASKYAVTAITGTLQLELIDQGSKIKVTSISPGLVRTDMINNSLEKIPQEIRQEYASKLPYLETEDIADATLYVLSTPKHVKVVGVARRKDRLDELAQKLSTKQGKFFAFRGDLSKEEDIVNAFKWTKQNVGPVSILINNAGVAPYGLLSNGSTEDWQNILNINVLAICIANRETIKQMKENTIDGHIININSIVGHPSTQGKKLNLYPASKHAVTAITETLQLELIDQGSKIKVTSISPGLVRTELITNYFDKLPQEIRVKYESKLPYLETEDIADATLYVLSTPKHVKISELKIQNVEEKILS